MDFNKRLAIAKRFLIDEIRRKEFEGLKVMSKSLVQMNAPGFSIGYFPLLCLVGSTST